MHGHKSFPVDSFAFIEERLSVRSDPVFTPCQVVRHTETRIVVKVVKPGVRLQQERAFRVEDLREVGGYDRARHEYSYFIPKLLTRDDAAVPRMKAKVHNITQQLTGDYVLARLKTNLDMCPEARLIEVLEKEVVFIKKMKQERADTMEELRKLGHSAY